MANKKVTKGEIELCLERFLIDSEDEFFPDPFRYKDIRLMQTEIVNEIQNNLKNIATTQVSFIRSNFSRVKNNRTSKS
jgi:hypothetical protein